MTVALFAAFAACELLAAWWLCGAWIEWRARRIVEEMRAGDGSADRWSLLHTVAHLLHWNMGRVEDWREGDRWMIGFRCAGCGGMFHAFEHGNDRDGPFLLRDGED